MKLNKDLNKVCGLLLAKSIKDLHEDAILADILVGDALANEMGFSYSFNCLERISTLALNKIVKQMKKNIDRNYEIKYVTVSKPEALEIFKTNKFKTELINDSSASQVNLVYFGSDYVDICEQLSIAKLSAIKSFELLTVGGVYWKHSSKNEQLQSISGIAFENHEEMEAYKNETKDREERDHRYINNNLELFAFDMLAGQGLPFWLPNGASTKYEIDDYVHRLLQRNGYSYVQTPVLGSQELYETSGHWFHYRPNMFPDFNIDGFTQVLRPMTCPHHLLVYKMKPRSYRELPFRVYEDAILHRYESSGSLTGLERVRQMRLIDCHMVCSEEQIFEVVSKHYAIIKEAAETFGITEYHSVDLSLHDAGNKEKFFDGEETWQKAENAMRKVLQGMGINYKEEVGEAAFYGPKIDIQIKTALGHIITAFTIQLDFLLPERFDLQFKAKDGTIQRPVLVHASVIGTLERFMAILLEQNKGVFPLWLAPVQAVVIPVDNEKHGQFCKELNAKLLNNLIRSKVIDSDERLSKKIRDAQVAKIPYQLVIGDEEINSGNISFRKYGESNSTIVAVNEFIGIILQRVATKR